MAAKPSVRTKANRRAHPAVRPAARRAPRRTVQRGWWVVGGLSALGMFCLAGCTAVLAGAAAGMLASSRSSNSTVSTPTVSTPTVGDSVDQAADAAGQVLARTIKEAVPRSVRPVPAGKPKITVATPAPRPAPVPTIVPDAVQDETEDDGAAEGR